MSSMDVPLTEDHREWFVADHGLRCSNPDCNNIIPPSRSADGEITCSDECAYDSGFGTTSNLLDDPDAFGEDDEDD